MSQTLREFIERREAEIKAQIRELHNELRDLKAAKSAIMVRQAPEVAASSTGRVTHRDMILAVLSSKPDGGTADRVIEWVHEMFGVEIPQASISSQLSRAKSEGALTLEQGTKIWRLATEPRKEYGPPESDPYAEE